MTRGCLVGFQGAELFPEVGDDDPVRRLECDFRNLREDERLRQARPCTARQQRRKTFPAPSQSRGERRMRRTRQAGSKAPHRTVLPLCGHELLRSCVRPPPLWPAVPPEPEVVDQQRARSGYRLGSRPWHASQHNILNAYSCSYFSSECASDYLSPLVRRIFKIGAHRAGMGRHLPEHWTDADVVASYRPRMSEREWAPLGEFVKSSVAASAITGPRMTERSLVCLAPYARWLRTAGYTFDAAWRADVIDYYTEVRAQTLTAPVVEYERRLLRRIGGLDTPRNEYRSRNRASIPVLPYSPADVGGIRRWAARMRDRRTVVALALGCGLTRDEVARTRTSDLHVLSDGGHAVHVDGERERVVPVRADFEDWLAEAAASQGPYPFKPDAGSRSKTLTELAQGHLTFQRARLTWALGHLATGVPANLLVDLAGVNQPGAFLTRLLPHLPEVSNAAAVAFARGGAR